jgi:hypothetical protein
MDYMFSDCSSLSEPPLFNFSNIKQRKNYVFNHDIFVNSGLSNFSKLKFYLSSDRFLLKALINGSISDDKINELLNAYTTVDC